MGMMSAVLTLLVALVILIASGRWLVRAVVAAARAFGLSQASMAILLLAVSTSLPELFVSVASAWRGAGDMVIATALGSNVVNMTLIVGLASVLSFGISTQGLNVRRDFIFGGLITILPLIFLLNGVISRLEGGVLLAAFLLYMRRVLVEHRGVPFNGQHWPRLGHGLRQALVALALVGVLIVAAEVTVRAATLLAEQVGLPLFLIGIFVLAFGTSLPELTTTVQAALARRPGLALGNILGSNVADSALIIGLAAVVRPLRVPLDFSIVTTSGFVVLALLLLGWSSYTRRRLTFSEGLLLIGAFVVFGGLLFLLNVD